MKVLGITAEFNPLHNGHIFQIQKAKSKCKADFVIVLMSGNFTQQGNMAVINKYRRAKIAVLNGADIVIELPTIYANSSAEYFAHAAIYLFDKLNIVDYITFGNEKTNISQLKHIANTIIKNENLIWQKIKINLKTGISFPKARETALYDFLEPRYIDILNKPNNILGIEYIKAIKNIKSKIKLITFPRKEGISATEIRNQITNNNIASISNLIPQNEYNILEKYGNNYKNINDKLFQIVKYKLITTSLNDLKNINEIAEGLENRLLKSAYLSTNYNDFIKNVKSKRYTESKLKRILINILLNIDKKTFEDAFNQNITYAHILAISKSAKKIIGKLSKASKINIITSVSDLKAKELDQNVQKLLNIDILASNIYSILNGETSNSDYTNRL